MHRTPACCYVRRKRLCARCTLSMASKDKFQCALLHCENAATFVKTCYDELLATHAMMCTLLGVNLYKCTNVQCRKSCTNVGNRVKCLNFVADTALNSYSNIWYSRTHHKAGPSKLKLNKFTSEGKGTSWLCFVMMTCARLMTNTTHY